MGVSAQAARILVLLAGMLLSLAVHAASAIVLIGDELGGVIMRDIAARERSDIRRHGDIYELRVRSVGVSLKSLAPGGALTALADVLHSTEIGLLVIDATRGPTPIVREHILVARQARTPMLAVMLANIERLHEKAGEETDDLVALEIRETRELLSAYELDPDSIRVYYDTQPVAFEGRPEAVGVIETLRALSLFEPRRAGVVAARSSDEIWSAVYLLTDAEAGDAAGTLSPNDSFVVWSEGTHANATLASMSAYHPGEYREMPLSMASPLEVREGSRILLLNGERVIGLGSVTQIGRTP